VQKLGHAWSVAVSFTGPTNFFVDMLLFLSILELENEDDFD